MKCLKCSIKVKVQPVKDNKEIAYCLKCKTSYKVVYLKGTYIKVLKFN